MGHGIVWLDKASLRSANRVKAVVLWAALVASATTLLVLLSRSPDVNRLVHDLADQDPHVREAAGEELVKLGKPAVEPLIACLKDNDRFVRDRAAQVLGKLGDARAVEPLIACLNDKAVDVREHAAEALGKLGDARAVGPLIASLEDPNHQVRRAAAQALEKLGDARAVEPLIACLKDSDPFVRERAAEALGSLGDARAVEPLIASLEDPTSIVYRAAAEAMGKFMGKFPSRRVALVDDRRSLHPWHHLVPSRARAHSVEDADLLLIVGGQNKTVLSVHQYEVFGAPAPSITRYQYDLKVELVEAKTGKTIAAKHFWDVARKAMSSEPYDLTRLGEPVSYREVEAWLVPHLVRPAKQP